MRFITTDVAWSVCLCVLGTRVSGAKWVNRSRCRFEGWLMWVKGTMSDGVKVGWVHSPPRGVTRWRCSLSFKWFHHLLLLACLMGQYCFARRCLSSVVCGRHRRLPGSVMLQAARRVGGRRACRRARRRSGGQHSTAGQYGYVPLGRHPAIIVVVTT